VFAQPIVFTSASVSWTRPIRINKTQCIRINIAVRIDAGREPRRIALDIPSKRRVVIAEAVVIEVRLRILVLSREAGVVVEVTEPGRVLIGDSVPNA
jgi:hypothetical protein